jgi:hypothetical protein
VEDDLQNPPITKGAKYKVLFLVSWIAWGSAVAEEEDNEDCCSRRDGM